MPLPLPTVVEDYVIAAIKHAVAEFSDDGTVGAYVPEFPGIVAFGSDVHECARNLYLHVEEWVRTAISQGYSLPVLDGIDLDSDTGRILTSYHQTSEPTETRGAFFENETALEKAFHYFDDIAALTSHGAA